MKSRGFTLIELLVVISIIALIASVVLASLNIARDKGRLGGAKYFATQVDHIAGDTAVGMWDFDECSGTTVADRSGYNNNGSFVGSPTWSTDTPSGNGCSLSFNASLSQQVVVPDNTVMDIGTGSVTRMFWFKTTQTARAIFFRKSAGSNHNGMLIDTLSSGTGQVECFVNDTPSATAISPLSYTDGAWHHVVCVLDRSAGVLNLYVDGSLKASTSAISLAGLDLTAGTNLSFPSSPFLTGLIDGVHIFGKALTASEVSRLYVASFTQRLADK